jgi:DNA polymerase III alpha subunit
LQQYVQTEANSSINGQVSLFEFLDPSVKESTIPKVPTLPDLDEDVKLQYEKETAYMYLSKHPLEGYRKWINNIKLDEITDIVNSIEEEDGAYKSGQNVVVPIVVSGEISKKISKKGTNVWFFVVADEGSEMSAVGFDKFVNQYNYIMQPEKCYILKGKLDQRDEDNWQIIANEIIMFPRNNEEIDNFLKVVKPVEQKKQNYHQSQQNVEKKPQTIYSHGLHIAVKNIEYAEKEIYPLLDNMAGSYPVFIYFEESIGPNGKPMGGRYPKTVNIESPNTRILVEKVGMNNVKWF